MEEEEEEGKRSDEKTGERVKRGRRQRDGVDRKEGGEQKLEARDLFVREVGVREEERRR